MENQKKESRNIHPLDQFKYCPKCGSNQFCINNAKSKKCKECGFTYYYNISAAVACFIRNAKGELLVARRREDPSAGMLDLPGGFVDLQETAEEAVIREIKEETGLIISDMRLVCTLPNDYLYSGFMVQTLDLFFEVNIDTFNGFHAMDDVCELIIMKPEELDPAQFAFSSARKAIDLYRNWKPSYS